MYVYVEILNKILVLDLRVDNIRMFVSVCVC